MPKTTRRKLVNNCYNINLDLNFFNEDQLLHFLFLIKTFLRCKLERYQRGKYFGTKGFMSKVLYIPKIKSNKLESLDICIVAEDSEDYKLPEDLTDEIRELYPIFVKVENEYYNNRNKKVTDFPELSKFFNNCIGSRR